MSHEEAYAARLRAPTPFKGAVGCVEYHARRYLELKLTEPQAAALWVELEADLTARQLRRTVREMQDIGTGSLDTAPREHLLDAIARTLTKSDMGWPCNADDDATVTAFARDVRDAIDQRGYVFMPVDSDPQSLTG